MNQLVHGSGCLEIIRNPNLNIMQIISGRGVNGALVYCKMLCEQLVERGHRVTLVCRENSWMSENVDSSKVQIIESSLEKFSPSELKRMSSLARKHRIDLIHTHMTRGQNFGVMLKLMTGIPVVATAHNRLFQLHWNLNDYVIANSQATFDYHARINRIPASRMEVVYCCSDLERLTHVNSDQAMAIRENLRVKQDQFLIGMIGEFATRKGQIHLIRALPRILKEVPDARVVLLGRFGRRQAHVKKIRRFILENNLAGVAKWLGRKSNVAQYMTACDVTVVPSLEEPLGLVAIESLMAKTPVVASRTGGLKEVVIDGQTGLLVPPGDENAIAAAVIRLAKDKGLREQLSQNGYEHVCKTFAPSNLIDQVADIYQRILSKTGRLAA